MRIWRCRSITSSFFVFSVFGRKCVFLGPKNAPRTTYIVSTGRLFVIILLMIFVCITTPDPDSSKHFLEIREEEARAPSSSSPRKIKTKDRPASFSFASSVSPFPSFPPTPPSPSCSPPRIRIHPYLSSRVEYSSCYHRCRFPCSPCPLLSPTPSAICALPPTTPSSGCVCCCVLLTG